MDTAIHIAHRVGHRLTIVGQGPEQPRLEQLAASLGADVNFVGHASDEEVRVLYRSSVALLFPGNEDFGIVPVEAMACGCPVVAAGIGGALETVVDGVTGVHARSPTLDDLVAATEQLLAAEFRPEACRTQAEQFSYGVFGRAIAGWFERELDVSVG
jgi:glycosyltransferase involved in cell wall biosynthesis